MMTSTSTQSFVATLACNDVVSSSLSSKHLDFATSVSLAAASFPKRAGFVASESFTNTLGTLVNSFSLADEEHSGCLPSSTSTDSTGLVGFAFALRAADAEAAAREDPRDVFATSDSFVSFDSVCTLDSEPSFAHMTAFELALLGSMTSSDSFASSISISTMSSEPSIAELTAFDFAILAHAEAAEATMVDEAVTVEEPASLLASLPSVDSAIGSIWSPSEKPYPHINAVQLEARAARARIGEAWWTRPTQRRGRVPLWGTYTSRDIPSFETVSCLLPDAASLASGCIGISTIPSSHMPAAPYVSGCRTHAQQLAHLYTSMHEAGVPVGSLLKLISDKPGELFVSPPPPPAKASAAKRALRAFGDAVSHLMN